MSGQFQLLKKIGATILASLICVSLVQCSSVEEPASVGTEEPSKTESGGSTIEKASVESIGLCFTEGGFSNRTQEAVKARFRQYAEMGVKTVRYETTWVSLSKGSWSLSAEAADTLQAAVDAGLRLKVISPTIMSPQTWVTLDPDAAMVDYNGVRAINTISYWYDGIYEYTADAINCQLQEYEELGLLDSIDALVVDFGPAGEPLYPAAWTQSGNIENPENENTTMWCYGENAVADFRKKMQEKYGGIEKANEAWGTAYASFEAFAMPKPGEVKGALWEEIFDWYLQAKRTFIEKQIQIFQEAVNRHASGRIQLILYMPGASFTEAEWRQHMEAGTASFAMQIGSENEFIVQMADKYDCLLQFTGLPGITSLKQIRQYMYSNGYEDIPVFGENYADYASSNDPEGLYRVIQEFNLAGLDYTFAKFLYEEDGTTKSAIFPKMEEAVPLIADFIGSVDYTAIPYSLRRVEARPEGDVLSLRVHIDISTAADFASLTYTLAELGYEIQDGDLLEYDVMISEPMLGFGSIDGAINGAGLIRDNLYITDQYGIQAHPQGELSVQSGGIWSHRVLGLSVPYSTYNQAMNTPGKVLQNLSLSAYPRKINGRFAYTDVTVYYDNIVITNNGKLKLEIFRSNDDLIQQNMVLTNSSSLNCSLSVEQYAAS